jgi:hypothetical protein
MNTKKCYTCGETKELTEFNKNKGRKDGLNSICRECSKARSKQYYAENREHHKKETLKRKAAQLETNRRFVYDYLLENPCVDCGETDPVVLEFDHLPGCDKKYLLSEMVSGGYAVETIKKEMEKCDVVCANCHRRRTAKRGNHYRYKFQQE